MLAVCREKKNGSMDVEQLKDLLEARVKDLEEELEQSREATHGQRIRALDLKYELREVGSSLSSLPSRG